MNDKADGETEGEQRHRLHEAARSELLERQRSNSESYDKAILTLSSGALGVSLTFIKDLLPASSEPVWTGLLYWSWTLLTAAIITTVASFLLSSAAINQAIKRSTEYYLEGNEGAFARTKLARAVDASNYTSGTLFVVGIILTVLFVWINFSEVTGMKTSKTDSVDLSSDHSVSKMQNTETVQFKRGQGIPPMQQVIPSTGAATASQGSSQGSATTAGQSAPTTTQTSAPVAAQTKK